MKAIKSALAQLLGGTRRRLFARETLLCALALSPGSLFVFLQLPPLWRDWDSLMQVSYPPGHNTLLQFPPLYPLISRLPIMLVSAVRALTRGGPLYVEPTAQVALNDLGIYLLIAAQHFALLLALGLFIVTAAEGVWQRALLVLLALATPLFFIAPQLVSSEALGFILMILLAALTLRLLQRKTPHGGAAVIVFGLVLYLNILTRHASAVLAALLPLAYFFALFVRRSKDGFRDLGCGLLVGLLAILLANATTRILCAVFKEPYRSVSSRTAIYRFDEIDRLPPAERAAVISQLQSKTNDPLTKEAIPRLLEVKGYWGQSLIELQRMIQQRYPPMRAKERRKLADKYLAEICSLYYRAAPRVLVGDITSAIRKALWQTTPAEIAQVFLRIGIDSLHLYQSGEGAFQRTRNLTTCAPVQEERIAAFSAYRWPTPLQRIPCGILLLGTSAMAILLALAGRLPPSAAIIICAFFATNLLLMIGTFTVSMFSERQVLPEFALAFAAVATLVGQVRISPRSETHP